MLKMEVAIPAPQPLAMDFDFNDTRPMPFLSVPSSPKRFGDYSLSAPTSPSRMAEFYHSFDEESRGVPFDWEERPGTPKSGPSFSGEDDFAFDISGELHNPSLTADELFDGGKIRPLKPPPRLQVEDSINQRSPLLSPRSPIAQGKKILSDAFSPKKKKNSDPFAAAVENTRKTTGNERGRDRVSANLVSSSSRRAARSVSPLRVSEYPWEEEKEKKHQEGKKQSELNSKPSFSSKGSSRKWRLKDFLFRSASEGRASDKDPYRNFPALFRKHEDVKDASFRSTDSSSGSKRRGRVSAHELHYTVNKAASQDLKKKTFLPYKQGILGRLAFNPAVHALANGFGTLTH